MLGLFLGGIVKRVLSVAQGASKWAWANKPWALLLIVCAVAGFKIWHVTGQRDHARSKLAATEKAFAQTIVNYRLAAIAFEKKQADNSVRVADEYKENANDQIAAYSADADNYRARFERLRAERNKGRTSPVAMPAVPAATGSAPQPDNNPADVADSEMIAVRIDDLEVLVNGALQGESVRKLWIANEAVDTDGE